MNIINALIKKKSFSLKAEGSSMLPVLHSGDVVNYRKTSFKKIAINDLVLVKKNNKLFTHRVIYKKIPRLTSPTRDDGGGDFLITKGDNNPESDGKIYPHNVIAKVQSVKRDGMEFDPNQIYLFQSSLYLQEIIMIKNLFEKQNIDFVFLKGLPLHLYYEGEHPKRIYADCDVLINPKNKNGAERILKKQRYIKTDSSFSKTQSKLQDREIETSFYKTINGFQVVFDIHYEASFLIVHLGKLEALYPQKFIDKLTDEFLKRKRKISIHGSSFHILSSTHLVIYLALHFFHHNYRGAFRLDLLDKVIRKTRFARFLTPKGGFEMTRWGSIAKTILDFRLQNIVYPTFVLLKKYYQTPIPEGFLAKIKPTDPLIREFVNSLIKINIFDDEPRVKAGMNRFKNLFLLSPEPLWLRVMIIFNPQVVYTAMWLMMQKIKTSSLRRQGSRRMDSRLRGNDKIRPV